ncbi:MAG: hypothetical protein AAFQ08_02620, partial [Bacteroidota bacterium]
RCRPLKGKKVILFPDVGGRALWEQRAQGLQQTLQQPVLVSDFLEGTADAQSRNEGIDLADYLMR